MTSTATSTTAQHDHPPVSALVALFFAPAFIFSNMYTTQAILPVFSHDFHINAPTAGLSVSVLVLAVAVGSLFYGPLSDRVGRKPVMVGASLLVAVPTLLSGLAPNFTVLLIMRALQGLLIPGLTSVAISYVNDEFDGKWRGLAMGIYVSGLTLGGLFARVGSAILAGMYNWRVAMFAFVIPTLLATLAMWRYLPDNTCIQNTKTNLSQQPADLFFSQILQDMWGHLRNRHLVGAFIIGFTCFFGFIGVFTYLPYYLTGPAFHLPTIELGLVYLLWLTGVFSPAAGTLAGRIGSRRAIAYSGSLTILGLLITLIPILPVVLIGLGLLTLGMFSIVPAINLYLGEQALTAKGTAASMYLSLYYFGGSLGAVLPGMALLLAGWLGVVLLCLGMMILSLVADAVLCR